MDTIAGLLVCIPIVLLMTWPLRRFLDTPTRLPRWDWVLKWAWLLVIPFLVANVTLNVTSDKLDDWYLCVVFGLEVVVIGLVSDYRPARTLLLAVAPFCSTIVVAFALDIFWPKVLAKRTDLLGAAFAFSFLWLCTFIFLARSQKKALEKERARRLEEARIKQAIEAQNAQLEGLVAARTTELTRQKEALEATVAELKSTQAQLVQAEKMASLGELTAGIAHEIQNPLNFVNNFSEISVELVEELRQELFKEPLDKEFAAEILGDLSQNQQKIAHHGHRAASIVKGMLEHSRVSTGQREPTDLNALADEYLRLAYHGLRARDKAFNAELKTDFDPKLGMLDVVPQDIGRVLLNLINNAFYAVSEKQKLHPKGYQPSVSVTTKCLDNQAIIEIKDNGTGIPEAVKAKIFQPFFTTKPTGQGTGLGLSLSYDIVTKGHEGTLSVESVEGEGTMFTLKLPSTTI